MKTVLHAALLCGASAALNVQLRARESSISRRTVLCVPGIFECRESRCLLSDKEREEMDKAIAAESIDQSDSSFARRLAPIVPLVLPHAAIASGGATAGKTTSIPRAKIRYYPRMSQVIFAYKGLGSAISSGDTAAIKKAKTFFWAEADDAPGSELKSAGCAWMSADPHLLTPSAACPRVDRNVCARRPACGRLQDRLEDPARQNSRCQRIQEECAAESGSPVVPHLTRGFWPHTHF